jgi:hypothetical protein
VVRPKGLVPFLLVTGLGALTVGAAALGARAEPQSAHAQGMPSTPRSTVPQLKVTPAPGSYTIPAGTTFSVSTTELSVGQTVTFTGNHCPPSEPVAVPFLDGDGYVIDPAPIVRNPDGTWEATPTVPVGVWGSTTLGAECGGSPTQVLFKYPQTYHVFISSPYGLTVTPGGTVAPGTTLHINPTTSFCSTLDTIAVGVGTASSAFSTQLVSPWLVQGDAQYSEPAAPVVSDVPWHATLTIPQEVNGGRYFVTAACMPDNRGFPGVYASQPITVTSSTTTPVPTLTDDDLVSPKDLPTGWQVGSERSAPLPGCFVQVLSSVHSVASVSRTMVGAHGHTLAFEDITSYADAADAYTLITQALVQCTMVLSLAPTNGDDRPTQTAREDPAFAPTFFGSEGFLDQWTVGRTKHYRAFALIRRRSSLMEVAVAGTGSPDTALVRQLVNEARRIAPH